MSRRWGAPAAFLALSAVFWFPVLCGRRALFYDILFCMDYPNAAFLRAALARGVFPLWNPHIYSGVPFLPNIQAGLFYPTTYLFAFLSFPTAAALIVWLHAAGAAWSMQALGRQKGFSAAGAALAGVIYGFNGFFVSHYAYLETFAAYAWLPAILYWLGRAASGSRRAALAAGLAGALEIFAGHPQFALYTAVAAAFFFLSEERRPRAARTLAASGAIALAASAVQWLPLLRFVGQSTRLAASSYGYSTLYSLRPAEMLRMLLQPLWNRSFLPEGDPHTTGFYFGLPVLALALAGLGAGRRARAFAALALGGALFALGRYGPLYPVLYAVLPPLRWFRFPVQAMFFACFGLAGLAGLGLDRLPLQNRWRWALVAVAAADLLLFARRAVITIDPSFYKARMSTPAYLRSVAGDSYRIMMTPRTRDQGGRSAPTELAAWLGFRDSLYPNLASAEGLLDAWGRQELRYAPYDGALSALSKDPNSPWMDALSIRYLLTFWDLPQPKFRLLRSGSVRIYENPSALPRAYFCPKAVSVPAGGEQAYLDSHPGFDFHRALLWDGPGGGNAGSGTVRIVAASENKLEILCEASAPGQLVVTDAFDPGWSASVNGVPAPIARANVFQRAVAVGAGRSVIEMRYVPQGLVLGTLLSILSLAAALVWAAGRGLS